MAVLHLREGIGLLQSIPHDNGQKGGMFQEYSQRNVTG